ncbi:Chondroitin AC/alginate lyase [Penicillium canescens]|uniref:Chondroitin AC/alginate lyase n=1 Tax=Penicillium canescens TaxID=5083 RepID=UPI0026E03CDC|nr:Chondroitin AC/alginate lyase [Penicillium canescens]KAJ6059522.1 Chondroitin AC/alginate lyase [Penicillium canescens]KAJ6077235.1 Chondroitin AC/alginate lyase [Penicillium canescens]KAJ6154005.1 Chondroitin AC/alginate lyase [Penicillium canescens]
MNYDQSARDAVVSVGLAAMSNVNRDKALRTLSREKHATVISAVQKAVDRWTVHLDGASALLRQSTFKRAMTTLGHRAQLQFYFASIVKYFLPRRNIPPDLLNWSPELMASAPLEIIPAAKLVDILIRFMKLTYLCGEKTTTHEQ